MRYYFYKMTTDNGGAPCVSDGALSLAICKPRIRATCKPGDWVFGFGARSTIGEKLIYIAQITKKLESGRYYSDPLYQNRPDAIYAWSEDGKLGWKRGSRYHVGGEPSDIGSPPTYSAANVLISENFRYFGRNGTEEYKAIFPELASVVEALKRGHRVNHPVPVLKSLQSLQEKVWRDYPLGSVFGAPHETDCTKPCSDTEGDVVEAC